jgi:hypothetical protein
MTFLAVTALALLSSSPLESVANDVGWRKAAQEDGISVFTRERKDTNLQEVKAVGMINAPPAKVWAAITDYENYKKTMPYTEVSRVISRDPDGKTLYFYSVINAPLVSRRDYLIRITNESPAPEDASGVWKSVWTCSDKGPGPQKDLVRVLVNDGAWLLQSKEDGHKTLATYYVYTDPGGSIPRWIANKANGTAVPNVFKSIRKTTSH